jgi:hypothetical protein
MHAYAFLLASGIDGTYKLRNEQMVEHKVSSVVYLP